MWKGGAAAAAVRRTGRALRCQTTGLHFRLFAGYITCSAFDGRAFYRLYGSVIFSLSIYNTDKEIELVIEKMPGINKDAPARHVAFLESVLHQSISSGVLSIEIISAQ